MLNSLLRVLLAGKRSVTLGYFRLLDGERVRFGLTHSGNYGVKPSYDGKCGRGGGFDGNRWILLDLLKHELGDINGPDKGLLPGVVLVLNDGTELTRADVSGPCSFESSAASA